MAAKKSSSSESEARPRRRATPKTGTEGAAGAKKRPTLSSSHAKKAISSATKGTAGSVSRRRAADTESEGDFAASPGPSARRTRVSSRKTTGVKGTRRGSPVAAERRPLAAPKRATSPTAVAATKASTPAKPKRSTRGAAETPAASTARSEAQQLALHIAMAGLEKKAAGIEILDVAGRVDYADFLVIMTGRSDRQVSSLAGAIEEALRKLGKRPISVEGLPNANWVLMDFGDVVVHVFQNETRHLYDIEGLWMDAKRVPVPGATDD